MSKISLKPNASGTGVFSLEAPNSNTDRTLTLRDETGDLVTTATDLEPQVKDSLNATGSAPVYACRAWVNFDGTGTVSIRDSGNVSSITDAGTGQYTLNFTTAMPDDDFSVVVSGNNDVGTSFAANRIVFSGFPNTDGSARVACYGSATTSFFDKDVITAAIFR